MKKILFAILVLFLSYSCKTVKLNSKPSPNVANEKPQFEESKIFIPLSLNLTEVEKQVDNAVPRGEIFYENVGCERKQYKVRVFRNNPMKVSTQNGKLVFKNNLEVKASGKYCPGVWQNDWLCHCCCHGGNIDGDANSTVALTIEIDLNIDENYKMSADTKVDGEIISGKNIEIKLLGFKISIPIEDVVGPIRDQLKPVKEQLDKEISKQLNKIDLKSELTKVWNEAHKTIPVDDFYLHIYPENIFFKDFTSQENNINVGVGVGTKLNLKSSQEEIEIKPLPKLTIIENSDGYFHINLPIDASFDKISSELNKSFKDKKYEYGNNWVKIRDVKTYGVKINENASGILFDVEIKGKVSLFKRVKGHLYFTAKPALDLDKTLIYLDDFKMNSSTNSEIINKGLEFLVNRFYYDDISKSNIYNYGSDLSNLENQIRADLSEIEIENYKIKLNLEKINLKGIYITDKILGIDSEAKGKIKTVKIE